MIRTASRLGAATLLAILAGAAACSSPSSSAPGSTNRPSGGAASKTATATLRVVNVPGARTPPTASSIIGVIGSYSGCDNYFDGTQWELATAGNGAAMAAVISLPGPAPDLNDSFCNLEIDAIYTTSTTVYGSGYASTNTPSPLYFAGIDSATAGTYLESAVGFDDPSQDAGNALAFYANAESDVVDSSGDFTVTLVVGDDLSVGSASTTASVQVTSGSVGSVGDVLPPDYSADLSNLTLLDDLGSGIVTGVTGTINLDFQTQAGEAYLTFPGQDLSTYPFALLDSTFNQDLESAVNISAGNVSIPVNALVNVGDQLPETSSILVWHADDASDVITYEVLAVTFNPPGG